MSYYEELRKGLNVLDEDEKPRTYIDDLRDSINSEDERDPIAKMNDNIQIKERLAYEEEQKLKSEEEPTFGSETYRALVGGTRDAAQGVLNLQDYLTDKLAEKLKYSIKFGDNDKDGELELSDFVSVKKLESDKEVQEYTSDDPLQLPEVDKNETIAGQIARDLTRFVVGTVVFRGARVGLLAKTPKVGKVFKDPKGPIKSLVLMC